MSQAVTKPLPQEYYEDLGADRPATARKMISELIRDVERLTPGVAPGCAGTDHPLYKDAGPRGLWARLRGIEDAMDGETLDRATGVPRLESGP